VRVSEGQKFYESESLTSDRGCRKSDEERLGVCLMRFNETLMRFFCADCGFALLNDGGASGDDRARSLPSILYVLMKIGVWM
jgi:hypothetical protein